MPSYQRKIFEQTISAVSTTTYINKLPRIAKVSFCRVFERPRLYEHFLCLNSNFFVSPIRFQFLLLLISLQCSHLHVQCIQVINIALQNDKPITATGCWKSKGNKLNEWKWWKFIPSTIWYWFESSAITWHLAQ